MLNRTIILLVAFIFISFAPVAIANGTLTHLSGKVSVQKVDGSTVYGSAGVQVVAGDTVVTGADGFVRLEMTDGGEMVIRQNSSLKIESYQFDKAKPQEDSFIFRVIKGGFRAVTGLISKRGNRDAYKAQTVTATIGIRGTQYDLRVCEANCGALADGTYVAVRFGAVAAANAQGNLNFTAGQVGFVPQNQPPVLLPHDPGVGFTPPATIPELNEKKKQSTDQGGNASLSTATGENNQPLTNSNAPSTDGDSGVGCSVL